LVSPPPRPQEISITSHFLSLRFGGDYNPEQWSPDVWDDDVRLMQRAGVTTATVGVFAWAKLEPRPGEFDFEWLDDILDRLHAGGVRVFLGTATASPPAWLARTHPETLPMTAEGVRLGFGSRQQYSPNSAVYRAHAVRLATMMATRYGTHPALEAWHVGNEYGCHVPMSYDPESAEAFRAWLRRRYTTIDALNHAWGTAFWSQGYADFAEIDPPAAAPTLLNPTQLVDFERFSSDALIDLYRAEVGVLRRITPGVPVTTNFMGFFRGANYWDWASEVDFVTDDSYPDPADPEAHVKLAASRDLMRSLGGGAPWVLMEQATSAVNWRPTNVPKPAGLNRVQSLQAVARGADGVLFFQWRQSRAGAEMFHSAMLPHSGENSRIFREVEALGAELAGLDGVLGEVVPAETAILFDWDSWRALEQDATPGRLDYVDTVLSWYRPLLRVGVPVDFVGPDSGLDGYRLVIVPAAMVASDALLDRLRRFTAGGGTLLVTYQSAVLDENLHVRLGGYLGALQTALGIRIEEFAPLPAATPATLLATPPVTSLAGAVRGAAAIWQDVVLVDDATIVSTFDDGFAAGGAAITRNSFGEGHGWYVATQPGVVALQELVARVMEDAGIRPCLDEPRDGVEVVHRGALRFLINHTASTVILSIGGEQRAVAPFDVVIERIGRADG
jgi:beta-galactosidase